MRLSIPLLVALALVGVGLGSAQPHAQDEAPPLKWIRIRYVDTDGKPIAHALLRTFHFSSYGYRSPEQTEDDTTDADGEWLYSLEEPEFAIPVGYYPVDVGEALYESLEDAANNGTPEFELVLEPELRASGQIVDQDGRPVIGAAVFVFPDSSWREGVDWFYCQAETDMWLNDRHELEQQIPATGIRARLDDKELPFDREDWNLFRAQRYEADGWSAESNDEGHFSLSALCPGRYFVWSWDDTGAWFAGTSLINESVEELSVQLQSSPTGQLKVNVRLPEQKGQWDRKSALILDGNTGQLHDVQCWWYVWELEVPPRGDVSVDIAGIPPGYYRAYLEDAPDRFVEIKAGETAELDLCDGDSLLATLGCDLFLDGEHIEKADFNVREPRDKLWKALDQWGNDNEGRVFKLHPGKYHVRCGDFWSGEVELEPGQTHELKAELESVEVSFDLIEQLKDPELPYKLACEAGGEAAHLKSKLTRFAVDKFIPCETKLRLPPCSLKYTLFDTSEELTGSIDLRGEGPFSVTLGESIAEELTEFDLVIQGETDLLVMIWNYSSESRYRNPGAEHYSFNTLYWRSGDVRTIHLHAMKSDELIEVKVGYDWAQIPFKPEGSVVLQLDDITAPPTVRFKPDTRPGIHYDNYIDRFAVQIVDSSGRRWFGHDVNDEVDDEVVGVSFPCAPGRAQVFVSRALDVGAGNRFQTVQDAVFEVDVAAQVRVIDPTELVWDDQFRGQVEVRIIGYGTDPDVASQLYSSDSYWSTGVGTKWEGSVVTIESLSLPGLWWPEELNFPRFYAGPEPMRINRTRLRPGRYRVIPWPGAPEDLWQEVEVKSGETTVVEIELP